jgi:glycerophosphoryl diester phosphodiesterase
MRIIAHRCGTFPEVPENSVAAARRSLDAGADMVELDIRFSRDGVPVVVHDPDFGRLCGIDRRVADCSAAEIAGFRYREHSGEGPRTFAEFTQAGIAPILIHFKLGPEELLRFLAMLEALGYLDKVVVGVLTLDAIRAARRFTPPPRTLAFMKSAAETHAFIAEGADIIRLWDPWVDPKTVEAVHAAGRLAWVMTGSPSDGSVGLASPARLAEYFPLGLDGILLNDVTLGLRAARAQGG